MIVDDWQGVTMEKTAGGYLLTWYQAAGEVRPDWSKMTTTAKTKRQAEKIEKRLLSHAI